MGTGCFFPERSSHLSRQPRAHAAPCTVDSSCLGIASPRVFLMMFETARVGTDDRRRTRPCLCGVRRSCSSVLRLSRRSAAQEREPAPKLAVRPSYPRTNLSTGYEVVPSWPARPKDLTWGAVAGIAISPSDQIWTFNRGPVPVQVYTADGELVRSWGQGQFREPHQVRIDRKGCVWLVDSGLHVVKKFTPDGKLLLTLGTPDEPGEDSTHLNRPTDVAVAPGGESIRRRRLRQQPNRPLRRARPVRPNLGKSWL